MAEGGGGDGRGKMSSLFDSPLSIVRVRGMDSHWKVIMIYDRTSRIGSSLTPRIDDRDPDKFYRVLKKGNECTKMAIL